MRPLTSDERDRVEAHLGLAWKVAFRLADSRNFFALEDLVSIGVFALASATRRYDPAMGAAFSTYATAFIAARVRFEVLARRHTIYVPPKPRGGSRRELIARSRTCRLTGRGEHFSEDGRFRDIEDAEWLHVGMERHLNDTERYVLREHWLRGRTFAEIGGEFGKSRQWAQQVERRAKGILRSRLKEWR